MLYVTYSGSIDRSLLENLINENNKLKNQVESINTFFNENQEVALKYEEWIEN